MMYFHFSFKVAVHTSFFEVVISPAIVRNSSSVLIEGDVVHLDGLADLEPHDVFVAVRWQEELEEASLCLRQPSVRIVLLIDRHHFEIQVLPFPSSIILRQSRLAPAELDELPPIVR